jgi:predicted amidohydrolase YtcJ
MPIINSFKSSKSTPSMKRLFFFFTSISLLSCTQPISVDLIVHNAHIYTVDSSFSTAEAMVINEGKLLEVGSNVEIKRKYKGAKELDVKGNFVYPGLIDAHCHFVGYANGLKSVNLVGTKSFEEVIERVKIFQKENQLQYITGRGWDQNDWEVKAFPNKTQLDELFPNTPVVLSRIDGHAVLVNQAAINYSRLNADTLLNGGLIEKDDAGKPTGILIDNAVDLIDVPELERPQMIEALKKAQANCFAYGLTTLDDAGLDRASIELIDSLQKAEELKMRMYIMVSDKPELQDYFLKNGPIKTERLNVRSFKFYADGALGSRGACLMAPYSDHANHQGFLLDSLFHFKESAIKLAELGWQMNTHAIGDSANRIILQSYGEQAKGKRWRIEHAQVVNPLDFKLFKKYEIIPSIQPTHATSDMYWAEDRLGKDRIGYAYAYKTLLNEYGKVALGTDFPVEDISTFKTFYAAVARKDVEGYPESGFEQGRGLERNDYMGCLFQL